MTMENEVSEQKVDLDYALAVAIRLNQSGQVNDEEEVYLTILNLFPKCPEALHFFGLLKHQQSDSDAAIQLIG
jgi:hypothetical protein